MFNGAAPFSGNSSLQSFGDGQYLTGQTPALSGNKCPICHKTFERLYNLKVHLRKHTGETPYDCPIKNCNKQFKWRSSMAHHVRAHHDISETMGIEVKCHARRSDQSTRTLNNGKKNATKSAVPLTAPSLSAAGVKKTVRKKVTQKGPKIDSNLSELGFTSQTSIPINGFCNLPQWGVGQSFEGNTPIFLENMPSSVQSGRESVYGKTLDPASESIRREENIQRDEPRNENDQLYQMVSEIFSRSTEMLPGYAEPAPQLHQDVSDEPIDSGLLFLADGSEDATDAEMESLAHYHGNLSISTSKETQSSADMTFVQP